MATRTELLLYQLGLRLVQAKELHGPHYLEQAVAVVRLSVVRLRDAFAPLCTLPNLGPDMGSASGILVEWLNEPRHFDRLGIAELHDREHLAETFKQRFDVMQEEVRTATSRRLPESRMEKWLDLGLKMLSIEDDYEPLPGPTKRWSQSRLPSSNPVVRRFGSPTCRRIGWHWEEDGAVRQLLADLELEPAAVFPMDEDLSTEELDAQLRESYFHGLEEGRYLRHEFPIWDIAELGLQRLWDNVEEDLEPSWVESQAIEKQEQSEADALPDGPGRQGAFRHQGKTVTGIEKKPWLLLKLAWKSCPEPVDLAVAGEEVWGNDIIDTGRVRTAASKANRALMEADIPITIHIQDEQVLLDVGD